MNIRKGGPKTWVNQDQAKMFLFFFAEFSYKIANSWSFKPWVMFNNLLARIEIDHLIYVRADEMFTSYSSIISRNSRNVNEQTTKQTKTKAKNLQTKKLWYKIIIHWLHALIVIKWFSVSIISSVQGLARSCCSTLT